MSTTSSGQKAGQTNYSGGAVGVIVFAAVLMMLSGVMSAVQGLVALVNDNFYVVGEEYLFEFDVTSWGWIHLIVGVVVAFAGFSLFQGATWARTVAVIVACLSIIANFLWIPYYPVWSLTVIAFGVFVIWAVTAHGRDILEP
jgi:hypothetical protein